MGREATLMRPSDQLGHPGEVSEDTVAQAPGQPGLTLLQQHFLDGLHRTIAKREQQVKVDAADKFALRLLARALYSAYMDCVANGVGDQASAALEKAQAPAA